MKKPADPLKGLESENRDLREELERARKDYEELRRKHTAYTRRSMDLERNAAALNYQVHKLGRDNETYKINIAGYEREREQLLALLKEAREEIEALKARLGG